MLNFLTAAPLPDNMGGKLGYGLQVTLLGMLIVFAVLIIIMLVIYLFQLIFYNIPQMRRKAMEKKKASAPEPAAESAPVHAEEDDTQLIAVLAAAVAAYTGEEPTTSRYRIRSFRRIL